MTQRLDDANAILVETITTVKTLATELRPRVLDTLGLAAAVEWQCQEFERRTGIACECRLPEEEVPLGSEKSTALFRILQEALTNVARHAGASEVIVELKTEGDSVGLSVRDNGRGATEAELSALTSLGLLGMQERAALLGGDVTVQGTKGEGTLVIARLPLDGPVRGGKRAEPQFDGADQHQPENRNESPAIQHPLAVPEEAGDRFNRPRRQRQSRVPGSPPATPRHSRPSL